MTNTELENFKKILYNEVIPNGGIVQSKRNGIINLEFKAKFLGIAVAMGNNFNEEI